METTLSNIMGQIAEAATISGRRPEDIELMAATKTVDRASISAAISKGISLFGENRVQEASLKFDPRPEGIRLHMIGHLQRNKARRAVEIFDCIESIDKTATAGAIEKNCIEKNVEMDILLEVNTSGEESKSGFSTEDELNYTLDEILNMRKIHVRGLMTIGPFTDDETTIRVAFGRLRLLFENIAERLHDPRFNTLSMGMSSDFTLAIEEGATRVRLGSALFGDRT